MRCGFVLAVILSCAAIIEGAEKPIDGGADLLYSLQSLPPGHTVQITYESAAAAGELYDGYANDLKLLRDQYEIQLKSGKTMKASSAKAVGAARRVFAKVSFLFKGREEVIQILGDPASISDYGIKMEKRMDSPMIYRFDTGYVRGTYKLTFRRNIVAGVQISNCGEDLAPGKYRVLIQSADDSQ